MIIRAIRLIISTPKGPFGFSFSFSRNLTVIRGGNSSGKSTFFNVLLYSLGMEEIVGGKGVQSLPYAVRDYFDFSGERIDVTASEVLIEIENKQGAVVTLRRAIRDDVRDTRLVEVFGGTCLTGSEPLTSAAPKYLHDAGSAKRSEGFFSFLEEFLGLRLPQVATTGGGEVKLYLQTIFAAHAVEQKRGWTDYIANIPFYGIRDARTRVAEYILGLGVFATISERNRLNTEAVEIDRDWRSLVDDLRRDSATTGVHFNAVPIQPRTDFHPDKLTLWKPSEDADLPLSDYISRLTNEHRKIREKTEAGAPSGEALVAEIESAEKEAQSLSVVHERATTNLTLQRASLAEYTELLQEAETDLERNKAALKLHELGADQAIELASGVCPTCRQPIEDTLLRESVSGPQMDLKTNIAYLESQSRMLKQQIAGVSDGVQHSLTTLSGISASLARVRDHVAALRGDLGSTSSQTKSLVRRQVQIEVEVEALQRFEVRTAKRARELKDISKRLEVNQLARRNLPPKQYTSQDEAKISLFEKMFRANASHFGYESVSNIAEIKINRDNLVPGLDQIELRQIKTDIKSDSSASDFVRLIWSYLLGLYQTSSHQLTPGNHLGMILFDEPGQHSMRWESQRELLLRLADEKALQSIVAASFDESETVFNDVTEHVRHTLISWEGKVIAPLNQA